MNDDIPDSVIQWHSTRKKGMLHFMFIVGGIWFVLIGMLYFSLLMTYGLKRAPRENESWALVVGVWTTGCLAMGFLGWHIKEAKYRRYKDAFEEPNQPPEPSPPSGAARLERKAEMTKPHPP